MITGFSIPAVMAVSPDGTLGYVNDFDGTVKVVDLVTNTVIDTIAGVSSNSLAVGPDGSTVYAVDGTSGT